MKVSFSGIMTVTMGLVISALLSGYYVGGNRACEELTVETVEELWTKEPQCDLQENGMPVGYKLVTDGEKWNFYYPPIDAVTNTPLDTKEEAIKESKKWCSLDMTNTIDKNRNWVVIE